MNQVKLFIELIRLKKPIGFMLLFWPCAWGLTLAFDFSSNLQTYFFYLILFFLGSVLMRSAGCIFNDIVDKDYDNKVKRTKDRPIAAGKISVKVSFSYVLILCAIALCILLQFNFFTIFLGLSSMLLAFSYPFMKRITYWPQLFLGITFNYGLILGWTSISEEISFIALIFYFGAIFWTLGYDTIYGYQDIKDDEIIGLKSTSIKFKGNSKKFLSICYLILTLCLIFGGLLMEFSWIYFLFLTIPILHLFVYQIKRFQSESPETCLKLFKSNNLFGLILLITIIIGKIFQ